MQASLTAFCNLDAATAQAVVDEGFDTPTELMSLNDLKDVKQFAKHVNDNVAGANIRYRSIDLLNNFRYWSVLTHRMGVVPIPASYDANEIVWTNTVINDRKAWKEANPSEPDEPKPLKDINKFRSFWERFDAYMAQVRGAAEISLRYIYREEADVTPGEIAAVYENHDAQYYRCTVLAGSHFQADNKRVFSVLKNCTLDGPGWSFIRRYDETGNGRAAVLALRLQAEGGSALLNRKERAYHVLNSSRYDGERRHQTFTDYVGKHTHSHSELEACREPLVESRKVTLFLQGITATTLSAGKDNVYGDANRMNSFEATQQYLSTLVFNKATQKQVERNVASLSSSDSGREKEGKITTNAKGQRISKVKKIALTGKRYESDIWKSFTPAERSFVLRQISKSKRDADRRKIAELQSKVYDGAAGADPTAEFGREAHKNKKQKQKANQDTP